MTNKIVFEVEIMQSTQLSEIQTLTEQIRDVCDSQLCVLGCEARVKIR
jgi:hypothetical protein